MKIDFAERRIPAYHAKNSALLEDVKSTASQ